MGSGLQIGTDGKLRLKDGKLVIGSDTDKCCCASGCACAGIGCYCGGAVQSINIVFSGFSFAGLSPFGQWPTTTCGSTAGINGTISQTAIIIPSYGPDGKTVTGCNCEQTGAVCTNRAVCYENSGGFADACCDVGIELVSGSLIAYVNNCTNSHGLFSIGDQCQATLDLSGWDCSSPLVVTAFTNGGHTDGSGMACGTVTITPSTTPPIDTSCATAAGCATGDCSNSEAPPP